MTARPWRTGGSVSIHIEATPDEVYAHISDVTRIGERSPECHSAEWLDAATPGTVGARFRGHNRSGPAARWSRTCEVIDAVPGRSFAFRTLPQRDPTRRDSTIWAYQLQPGGTGTQLTHSYEITMMPLQPLRALYGILQPQHRDMRPQMLQSLQTLKALLEHHSHH
ncbi:SRPBCC family protein [Planosporangium thailandense]|uniref:SRPBCC family protein n=1 Tax=Planosporangium thailandense TaxID=765197 RepID=A0ABX0Y0R4_9ACTN|nr:SRPBCC family protein [Planosporangium thailandense]